MWSWMHVHFRHCEPLLIYSVYYQFDIASNYSSQKPGNFFRPTAWQGSSCESLSVLITLSLYEFFSQKLHHRCDNDSTLLIQSKPSHNPTTNEVMRWSLCVLFDFLWFKVTVNAMSKLCWLYASRSDNTNYMWWVSSSCSFLSQCNTMRTHEARRFLRKGKKNGVFKVFHSSVWCAL